MRGHCYISLNKQTHQHSIKKQRFSYLHTQKQHFCVAAVSNIIYSLHSSHNFSYIFESHLVNSTSGQTILCTHQSHCIYSSLCGFTAMKSLRRVPMNWQVRFTNVVNSVICSANFTPIGLTQVTWLSGTLWKSISFGMLEHPWVGILVPQGAYRESVHTWFPSASRFIEAAEQIRNTVDIRKYGSEINPSVEFFRQKSVEPVSAWKTHVVTRENG